MALVVKDRVKETTTTVGTGTVTLAGAVSGFQSFAAIGNGNSTYYVITDTATGDWEVGIGTYTSSGTTLSRTTVLSSSNAGSLVSFAAGIKDVFVSYPSSRAVYQNEGGTATVQNEFTTLNATTANITTANITAGTVSTTPASGTDIANKTYVDTMVASGITYHAPVKYEAPNALTATYNNGTAGVGATLTNSGTLGAFTPDGVVASLNDRVLIYQQANAIQNGVYTVTTVGSGSVPWVLTRATDANTYGVKSPNSLGEGDAFFVTSGNTGAGETYVCNTQGTITFGTTNITFVQVSSAQIYSAGTGLTLSGTQFSITNTGVSASTYGSASSVPVLAVNAQGQLTSVTNTPIAITGAAVSGNIAGSAGSVANALTAGTFLTSGGTYDGSVARTFAVDATSANTASKVVARDASGNFSAGTITATLSGAATSATTATNLAGGAANQLAYQTATNTTGFTAAPTASGELLSWNGSAYAWTLTPTISSITLSGGTANGVAYLNGSKVLTTGSALTFDGTNFGLGTASPDALANFTYSGGGISGTHSFSWGYAFGAASLRLKSTNAGSSASVASVGLYSNPERTKEFAFFNQADNSKSGYLGYQYGSGSPITDLTLFNALSGALVFGTNNSEQGRWTTTGLGIGTSSPANKLHLYTATAATALNIDSGTSGTAVQYSLAGSPKYTAEYVSGSDFYAVGRSGVAYDFVLKSGNVGIGTSSPAYKLDVSSSGTTVVRSYAGAGNQAYVSVAGNAGVPGTSSFDIIQDGSSNTFLYNRANTYMAFGTNNTERARITSGGTFSTSLDALIYGITVGRGAGAVSTNTAVGATALAANTTGYENVAVGSGAMNANINGYNNVSVGRNSLFVNTSGALNTALGDVALRFNTTGNFNTAVGGNALYSNTTASGVTAVGYQAAYSNTTGIQNAFFGYQAGYSGATASANHAFGYRTLYATTTGESNNGFGAFTLGSNTTGSSNTAFGHNGLVANTTGSNNVAMGAGALASNTTANNNTAVGHQAGNANTTGGIEAFGYRALFTNTTGTANAAFGYEGLALNTTGNNNTAIGVQALRSNTTASNNTAVGYQAGYSNTTGTAVTALGFRAAYTSTTANNITALGIGSFQLATGGNNTGVGASSGYAVTTGTNNTFVGYNAGPNGAASTGSFNTSVGVEALTLNTTANNNTAVGYQAGRGTTTGVNNTYVGGAAGFGSSTGSNNVGVGQASMYGSGDNNVAVGNAVLNANTTGSLNAGLGHNALLSNTTGGGNTALGYQTLVFSTTASFNTAVGYQAGFSNTTGYNNAAVGTQALYFNTTGALNTAMGDSSLAANTTGNFNTAVGRSALGSNTTASSNTAVGYQAGYANTTGVENSAFGATALYFNTTGVRNVALGRAALEGNTTGSYNTAQGYQALQANTTASNSTAVGYQAGYNATGAGNTIMGVQAGYSLSSGTYNNLFGYASTGYGAGGLITTGSKNTIIGGYNGNQGGLDIRTANNYVVLSDGDGLPRLYSTNTGQVFIPGDNGARPVELGGGFVKVKGESGGWEIGYRFGDQSNNNVGAINAAGANNSLSYIYIAAGGATSTNSAARFTANGIGLGTTSPATSGVGITFPATQNASSDANTLDDYEEGSWTPIWTAGGISVNYSEQTGRYIKIGRMVYYHFRVVVNSASGGSGVLRLDGLPFTHSNGGNPGFCSINFSYGWGGATAVLAAIHVGNTTFLDTYTQYAAYNSNTQTTASALTAGGTIYFIGGGCYEAAN